MTMKKRILSVATGLVLTAALALSPAVAGAGPRSGVVNIKLFTFHPNYIVASPGETLTVNNQDYAHFGEPHTLTANDGSFDTGLVTSDPAYITAPEGAGNYAFLCNVHPFMRGVVHVTNRAP